LIEPHHKNNHNRVGEQTSSVAHRLPERQKQNQPSLHSTAIPVDSLVFVNVFPAFPKVLDISTESSRVETIWFGQPMGNRLGVVF
jgi:hypothetical protein